ncbi:AMP-binding protein [Polaribacter septentrionalilitoris]|uniref:AMP-binding protein n=1 Tax=Polaribacter septentrionalilitoris TaxID=2494657 RepID=UPI0019151DC4|nr:AMP-binding protein [Polaribacter septentrionalilitoris]
MLKQNSFHKDFKLNNNSFSSVDELLAFSCTISDEIYSFLNSWFSSSNTISVQTSGSTGIPKPILLKKQQMINSALATGDFFDTKENTLALLCLSPAYIAGKMMLVRAITLGWHLDVITPDANPLQNLDKYYDFTAMVPLQLKNSITYLSNVKKIIVGGGVVSNELQDQIQNTKCKVFATYGMTETITHIAIKPLNNQPDEMLSCGKKSFYEILPNIQIYKDKRDCLVIEAPKVSDEIIFTNDVVDLISDTKFEWLGRHDHVINSGGVKLYPEKIEEKLSKIISNRFFVAGIPDAVFGEKLIVIIEGQEIDLDFNSVNLSKFEKPKKVYFIQNFKETITKKIQRKKTLDLVFFG